MYIGKVEAKFNAQANHSLSSQICLLGLLIFSLSTFR